MLNPLLENIYLSEQEYQRYARHLILDNIGIYGQQRLKKTKVLFIGAGGLACPAILYLASAGIGCIGVIDDDKVSISNLHRQILYNQEDINRFKVNSAKMTINKINPLCKIETYPYILNADNSHKLIQKYDIIVDASDNFKTRYIIDSTCYKLHKIHIYGAIQNFEGQISVFNYKNGPKYSDLYPENLNLQENNCNQLGVISILPGLIGILQATEVIKIVLGAGNILSGYLLVYNALNISFKKIKIKHRQIYKTNNIYNNLKESNKTNAISIGNQKIIIDVRQKKEFEKYHIQKSINIPLKKVSNIQTIQFIYQYCINRNILIYCNNNARSTIASKILDKYNIKNYKLDNDLLKIINIK